MDKTLTIDMGTYTDQSDPTFIRPDDILIICAGLVLLKEKKPDQVTQEMIEGIVSRLALTLRKLPDSPAKQAFTIFLNVMVDKLEEFIDG